MIIRKQFQFDAAHMLSNYEGKCHNLHGHTYTGDIEINAPVADDGMVLDFNVIKYVIDQYDHATLFSTSLCRESAEEELYSFVVTHEMRYKVIPYGKCTAENIATAIAADLAETVKDCIHIKVWLHETPGSTVIGEWIRKKQWNYISIR